MREDCCGYTAAVSCFISGKTYHYSRYVCAGKLSGQDFFELVRIRRSL